MFRSRHETIPREIIRKREKKVEYYFKKQPYVYQLTSGHGYNYPIQTHINTKIKRGLIHAWTHYQKDAEVL